MNGDSMDHEFRNDDAQFSTAPPAEDPRPAWPLEEPAVRLVDCHPARTTITAWQRAMLRRLAALLCTGTLAFTLTTWILVQRERRAPAVMAVARTSMRFADLQSRKARRSCVQRSGRSRCVTF